MAVTKQRYGQGEKDLYNVVISKSAKALHELIDRTWKMHESVALVQREKLPRMTLLQRALASECVC